jgi:hypothetical protein
VYRKSAQPTALERIIAVERMVQDMSDELMRLGAELRALTITVAGIEHDVIAFRDRRP